jgi:hypothetical protein
VISFNKKDSLKILRKVSFLLWGGQFGPLEGTVCESFEVYSIFEVFWQSFSRKISSVRTVRVSSAVIPKLTSNHIEWCAARVDRADGPHPTRGRSLRPWRTVRPAQHATLTTIDFAFLPLEFKRGQSVRPSRTVREGCVFDITTSNRKGDYKYSMPGLGESLLAL